MNQSTGKIDLAVFREVSKEQRERAKGGPEEYTIRQRALIQLIEDQLKEAGVEEYTIRCDEAKSRKGRGNAPSPLQYFVARWDFESSVN